MTGATGAGILASFFRPEWYAVSTAEWPLTASARPPYPRRNNESRRPGTTTTRRCTAPAVHVFRRIGGSAAQSGRDFAVPAVDKRGRRSRALQMMVPFSDPARVLGLSIDVLALPANESISNCFANRAGLHDFWQKHLKHPSNSFTNNLAKYSNLTKTLPYRAYMTI